MNIEQQLFLSLTDANNAANRYLAIGVEQGRQEARADIRAILAAYAMCDNVLLPTPLVAALEQAKRRMG